MKSLTVKASRNYRIVLCFLTIAISISVQAQEKGEKKKSAAEADNLFKSSEVLKIKIEIPQESIEKLSKYQWQFGPQKERESVKATLREGDTVLKDVALHLKGAAGSFRPITDNPALTLNLDKFV